MVAKSLLTSLPLSLNHLLNSEWALTCGMAGPEMDQHVHLVAGRCISAEVGQPRRAGRSESGLRA